MKIVSILNIKGGTGKTTLATNLAYRAQYLTSSSILIDSDPHGCARNWHAFSEGKYLDIIGLDRPTLDTDLKRLKLDREWIFIDGASQLSVMTAKAISCSNIVLIPVTPCSFDILGSNVVAELVKERQIINENLKAAFVIMRISLNTRIGKQMRTSLLEYELPIFNSFTASRTIYAVTSSMGTTVYHENDIQAQQEITNIFSELMEFSHENNKYC